MIGAHISLIQNDWVLVKMAREACNSERSCRRK